MHQDFIFFRWFINFFMYSMFYHYWSRHHSVLRGTMIFLGWLKTRLHTSCGTLTHSSWGFRLGISFVTSLQVFMGTRSQVSSGISTRLSATSSWHSSSPSMVTQPWPQTSKGSFSHFVLVIVFLCWKCKVFTEILFFDHLLKIVNLVAQDENYLSGAGSFVHRSAFSLTRSIAYLLLWSSALPKWFSNFLFIKNNFAFLLIILLAHLFLGRCKECDVSFVTFFFHLVSTTDNRIPGDTLH